MALEYGAFGRLSMKEEESREKGLLPAILCGIVEIAVYCC